MNIINGAFQDVKALIESIQSIPAAERCIVDHNKPRNSNKVEQKYADSAIALKRLISIGLVWRVLNLYV